MNLQGHRNDANESRPGYLLLSHWCLHSARVWLSCQAIIGILFLRDCFRFLQIQSHMSLPIKFVS